jgi:hypothetical protein
VMVGFDAVSPVLAMLSLESGRCSHSVRISIEVSALYLSVCPFRMACLADIPRLAFKNVCMYVSTIAPARPATATTGWLPFWRDGAASGAFRRGSLLPPEIAHTGISLNEYANKEAGAAVSRR